MDAPELTFCVVAPPSGSCSAGAWTRSPASGRRCRSPAETLVLDNCSRDGSAELARAHPAVDETIALERRTGKGANDSQLLARAAAATRCC